MVRRILNESVAAFWSDADLNAYLDDAHTHFWNLLTEQNENWFLEHVDVLYPINTEYITLDALPHATISGLANDITARLHTMVMVQNRGSWAPGSPPAYYPGLPTGTVVLTPSSGSIPADGDSYVTVTSATIMDAYGTAVPDGTLMTVATDLGSIGTTDANESLPGIQVAVASGIITFTFVAGFVAGTATIRMVSVDGDASGDTTVTLT